MSDVLLKLGDVDPSGYKVDHIFGVTKTIAVFRRDDGQIRYMTKSLLDGPDHWNLSVEKFHSLLAKIPFQISEKLAEELKNRLAYVLFVSLDSKNEAKALEAFSTIENRILDLMTLNQVKIYHYCSCILSSIAICLATYFLFHNHIGFCGMAGVLGATISLLQRGNTIHFDEESGKGYIFFQAALISVLGFLSGVCIYIVSNSDLILSFAKNNLYNLLTFSLISGFSERFIPELFTKVRQADNS